MNTVVTFLVVLAAVWFVASVVAAILLGRAIRRGELAWREVMGLVEADFAAWGREMGEV